TCADSDARAWHHASPVGVCHCPSRLLGHLGCSFLASIGQQYRELLTAPARDDVGAAERAPENLRHVPQHVVTDEVAELVVYRLEAVDVDEDQADVITVAEGP